MKKSLLLLLCTLCFGALRAQEGFHIGLLAMPQNTWILNTETLDQNRSNFEYVTTWGYSGMFKLGYNIGDPFGIHTAISYSRQGQRSTSIDTSGVIVTTKRDLTYLKIPLLIHINSDPGPAMFTFEVGPQVGILLDASHLEDDVPRDFGFLTDLIYRPTEISVTWSLGAEFCITDWFHFVLQHRGDYALFDIEDKTFLAGQSAFDPDRSTANSCNLGLMGGFNFCFLPRG
ncbi:MAG: porin family protein, partial [Bacteroidota bacterium]